MSCKRITLVVVVILAIVAAAWYRMQVFDDQTASGPKPNFVVVTGGSSQFWQLIGNGAKAAAANMDADLKLLMPEEDEDLDEQNLLLTGIKLDEVSGVALSPLDAKGQSSLINRMVERVSVITMDSDAPESARSCYVGTNNLAAGRACAELVKEALPEGGKVAVLIANLTKQNMIERKHGFEEVLAASAGTDYEVVDFLVDEGAAETCMQRIDDAFEKYPDLDCLVGMNAQHGPCILKALKAADKLGAIKVVAFDEVEETLDGVEAGLIYATVTQDPYQYGYQSVCMLADLARADETQRPLPGSRSSLSINTRVVRQGDVEKFREDLQLRLK